MRFTVVSAALLAAVLGSNAAFAQQALATIKDPAELPPAGFKGQMYVDSKGCVFLRAGYGGTVNWVPRVGANRKPLCGFPPTLQAMAKPIEVAEAAAAPAAAPAPARLVAPEPTGPVPRAPEPAPTILRAPDNAQPMPTVALTSAPPAIKSARQPSLMPESAYVAARPAAAAAPVAAAPAPARVFARPSAGPAPTILSAAVVPPPSAAAAPARLAVETRPAPGHYRCDASAPVAQVLTLSNGGTAVLCTRGDGTLNGARAPEYAVVAMGEGDRVGAGLYPPKGAKTPRAAAAAATAPATVTVRQVRVVPVVPARQPGDPVLVGGNGYNPALAMPKGWKSAWDDDRLNPMRGRGTARGQAQQDQVWTREVPARLVSAATPQARVVAAQPARVVISTKAAAGQPAPRVKPATGGKLYVQVGTFGEAINADGAKARLRAAGLPVGTAKVSKGGRALQMVLAGPFADAGSAQAALGTARAAGFGDAFIR